jgi:hypothetical protein
MKLYAIYFEGVQPRTRLNANSIGHGIYEDHFSEAYIKEMVFQNILEKKPCVDRSWLTKIMLYEIPNPIIEIVYKMNKERK